MPLLAVKIVAFVDECQPGVVACEFTDADGNRHTIVDKVPIFSTEQLWSDSTYPVAGEADCYILKTWLDATGRELAQIRIAQESLDGLCEFTVLASQIRQD